ncbi:MAG: ABC transporter ATP-binding protein [Egibacteraceae bacterium]
MSGVIETAALSVGYRGRRGAPTVVLAELDLSLQAGTLTCLLGPNGSGKSTLLRTLAGMQAPLAGSATLLGTDIRRMPATQRAQRLAVVLTDRVDAGILRVTDLVALGRYPHTGWSGRLTPADHACVAWALAVTGVTALAERNVAELSDGERQRVLVARALAQEPAVLALDEPVAYIDVPRRVELTALLRGLARERGLAVLLTTHDLDLAIRTADTVWLLEPTEPTTVHVGAPEDLVLNGTIARAFHSDDVSFDLLRGAFLPHPATRARCRVEGSGVPRVWTVRALEREGIAVAADDSPADFMVEVLAGDAGWRLHDPGGVHQLDSVGALVARLRGLLPVQTGDPVVR